jgi:hypothetical protein
VTGDQRVIFGWSIGEEGGAGESSQDIRKSIKRVMTKRMEGELERGLRHQPREWFVIGGRIGDLYLKFEVGIKDS